MTPEQVWEFCEKCKNHPSISRWDELIRLPDVGDQVIVTFAEWSEKYHITVVTINNREDYGYINDA